MTKPSFADYGTYDESAHRDLWDGVVGYWAPCLGPTGTRLFDVSRYNNWGTLTNMDAATDWVIDGGGYALDFDGVNDVVSAGIIPSLNTSSGFALACWYYARSTSGLHAMLNQFGGDQGCYLFQNGTSLAWQVGGITNRLTVSSVITSANRWYHIVAVKKPSFMEAFVDGKTVGSVGSTGSQNAIATSFLIGGNNAGVSVPNALIDDVVVWSRGLSPNEAARLYNLGRGGMLERRRRRRVYSVQDTGNRRRRIICGAEC